MFNVNRESFLHSLEAVQAGLSRREIIEQSSCFVFEGGRVVTFNDEISCQSPSGLDKKFVGAVQAESLLSILQKLPEEEIQIEEREGEIVLIGKRRKAGLRMEKEINLPISAVDKPETWTDLHKDFTEAINIVQQCASSDQSQFALVCVHIHPKWVEASDYFQLCRWKLKTGIKEPILVRRESIKHITSLGVNEFSETDSWLHFKNPNGLIISCRRYLEDFPDLTPILDVSGTPATLPKGLADAAEKAEIFSKENADNNVVLVEISPGKVRLKGQGISGWYTETKKMNYTGEPIAFYIAPELLREIVQRHNDCQITEERLMVDAGNYRFVSCLVKPDEKQDDNSDSNGEEETPKPKKKKKTEEGDE